MNRPCRWPTLWLTGLAALLLQLPGRAETQLALGTVSAVDTRPLTVPVTLTAGGEENALSWSVVFDPARLRFQQALLAEGATNAALFVNTAQADAGRVGLALSLPPGEAFAAGARELARLRFEARGGAGTVALTFGDTPLPRQTVNRAGAVVPTTYVNGSVQIAPLLPPAFIAEPADQTAYAGANAVFRVTVTSDAPVTYQWQKDGADLPGETGPRLVRRRVTSADQGLYRVRVANAAGAVTSREARLTVPPGLREGLIGQWDFDGDLVASVGLDLAYRGDTTGATTFETRDLDGAPARVMGFPRATQAQGYRLFHDAGGNGGGTRLNRYTFIADVLFPAGADRQWRALLQTDPNNNDDAEFYVGPQNGLWLSGGEHGTGLVTPNRWHRLAFVVDVGAGTVGKFINGTLVHRHSIPATTDNAYSLGPEALLFTENNLETAAGYVNSVQLYNRPLTDEEIRELGAPVAEGLPRGQLDQLRPTLLVQPASQTVRAGEAVTLTAVARGTPPLVYRWERNGVPVPGATERTLTLPAVTEAEAGEYRLIVSNALGAVTSAPPAVVALSPAERRLQPGTVEILQGRTVDVPVTLTALGGEAAGSWSVVYDPAKLRFVEVLPAAGATALANTSQAGEGKVGVLFSRPPGQTLAAGTNELVRLRFTAVGEAAVAPLEIGAAPLPVAWVDAAGNPRAVSGATGQVVILSAPRIVTQPASNAGAPGGSVSFSVEVVGTGPLSFRWRFNGTNLTDGPRVSGATTATLVLSDLQPADAGVYSVAVENRVGAAVSEGARLVVGRLLRVEDASGFSGERVEVPVRLFALGGENSLGASVAFDPAQIELLDVVPGAQTAGGNLLFNGARAGRVGFGVALPAGQSFNAGWQEVARLGLRTSRPVSRLPLTLGNDPVPVELTDALAQSLPVTTLDGSLTTTVRPVDVEQLPDLVPADLTAPAEAQLGQPVLIQWRVRNAGRQPAVAPWREALYVAPTPEGTDRRLIAQLTASEDLPSEGEVLRSQTLVLPPAAAGVNYLLIEVDPLNAVAERIETNNRAVSAAPLTLRAPDLTVTELTAPASALQGASINVAWTVRNTGSAPTTVAWQDRLLLVPALGGPADGLELALLPARTAPLAPAAQYRHETTVTLPLSHAWPPGAYRLVVVSDFANAQAELDEGNNQAARPFELTLPPLPDLVVNRVSAPAEARPGEPFELTWEVENRGTAPAGAPWREAVSFVHSATGERPLLLVEVAESLAAGARVTRRTPVSLPENAPTGTLRLVVTADAREDVVEQNEANNRREADAATTVPRVLTLRLALTEIREDAQPPTFTGTVVRSGERDAALTVTLANSAPAEIQAPATVLIPAGRSDATFTLRVLRDDRVDGPQVARLTASAPGYSGAQAEVRVLDVDVPRLTVQFARPATREDQRVNLTVTRELVGNQPLAVAFESAAPDQLLAPAPVVIPAGQAAVTVEVVPVDDVLLEPTLEYELRAVATGYQPGVARLAVEDNDVPQLTVTVDRPGVSEGDGPQAANLTVIRSPVGPQAIEVDLASSLPARLTVPARVTLPPNRESVSAPVAAVENTQVDGDQEVLIRAFPLSSAGRIRLAESAPARLTVRDNDGPALTLTVARTLVAEGLSPATTATVSRNTATHTALTVSLSSSDETEATVPPTVGIPAGAVSATFPVNTVQDQEVDGDQTVTLRASAAGFSPGEATLVVSDRDLPDLVVGRVEAPEFVTADTLFNVTYSVVNQGLAPAGTNWLTRIYLSSDPVVGDDQLLRQYSFTGTMPVNQRFEQTIAVQAPLKTGNYWIVVVTDVADQIREGLEDNNARVSAVPVQVRPAYGVTVATDLEQALAGTPVEFYGTARNPLGQPMPSVLVNIHIRLRDTRRIISALTGADGTFRTSWQPLPNEAGVYEVGAAHPGVDEAEIQDRFTLIGMRADPAQTGFRVIEESSITGRVRLLNLSPVALTGLRVEVLEKPDNLTVQTALGSPTLPGVSEVPLDYTVTAADASIPGGLVKLRVTSTEGAAVDLLWGVTVEALRPKLVARPAALQAGVLRGRPRTLEFSVANEGGRETGPLNVALPNVPWISLATVNPLPSLRPGESSVVALLLTPPADLPLGIYNGTLVLAGERAFLSVPYDFRALSEGRGGIVVTVVDEFTYYAEGSPKVEGATVTLRDPFTHATAAQGVTGADGTFRAEDLMEGFYNLEVGAPKHTTTRFSVFIEPGVTGEQTVFISRETVRYTWKVEPVQIEDHYKITIETEFETVVPTPVITVEPTVIDLAQITADITQVDIRITNHGLIAADAARLHVPTHPRWSFEPLIEEIGVLPARSSLTIPMTIRRVGGRSLAGPPPPRPPTTEISPGARQLLDRIALHSDPCHTSATVTWELKCGPFQNTYSATISIPNAAPGCVGVGPGPIGPGGGVWIGPGGGCCGGPSGPGGGPSSGFSGPAVNIGIQCDPLCVAIALWGCIPGVNCVPAGVGCVYGWATGGFNALTLFDCLVGIAGCVFPPAALPACIYALLRCFVGPAGQAVALAEAITLFSGNPRLMGPSGVGDALKAFEPGVQANLRLVELMFGGDLAAWVREASPDTGEWFRRVAGALAEDSEEGRRISATELAALNAGVQPPGVPAAEVQRVLARLNRTVENWSQGILKPAQVALAGGETDFMDFDAVAAQLEVVQAENRKARDAGFATPFTAMMDIVQEFKEGEGGTCAKVKLRLEQEAVITRDAFRATLEIQNDDTTTLDQIRVDLKVYDQGGRDVSDLFGIRPPELSGLSDVSGTGRIGPGGAGSAKWLIIPSVDAAPVEPVRFFVAGEFAYVLGDARVTVPLEPVSITVLPTPLLYVKYFHQRDVFSDDPFTPQIEPSIPFSLAVLIENRGHGVARNFRITSAQPEIVENEKGLLIDFKIIATEVAGRNMVPSLTAEFGDIDPGRSVVGRWLMTSTLQGLFINYSASFEHVDGLGNPRLSLIQDLSIHEMIKLVRAGGAFEDGLPDFFVNEVPDALDLGDTLYLSNGATNRVELVDQATVDRPPTESDLEVELTAVMPGGWAYLRVPDPADGRFRLQRVVRSDGVEIPVEVNVWVTDRTFLGMGKRPRRENLLHLLDYDSTGRYTLHYTRPPELDLLPPVSRVNPLPADSRVVIPLTWSGTDNEGGSGIAGYDIYVSEDGGPFQRWLWNTRDTAGSYFGQPGKRYAFYSRALDAAGNLEDAPATPDTETTVTLLNRPPELDPVPDQVLTEGDTLLLFLRARDPDGDSLTFGLEGTPPAGLFVNAQNGELRWVTGEGLGGRSYPVTVSVRDNGAPRLGTTRTFQITVRDRNNPPVLEPPPEQTLREGADWSLPLVARDFDVPAQTLRFELAPGAPAGLTVDATTGLLRWRPDDTQGGRRYEVTVRVTDSGDPPLSAETRIGLVVRDTRADFDLRLGTDRVAPGETGEIPVHLRAGRELSGVSFRLVERPPRTRVAAVQGAPLVAGATVTVVPDPGAGWAVDISAPAAPLLGDLDVALLNVQADTEPRSAWVPLEVQAPRGTTPGGLVLENARVSSGSLFIVHDQPVLTPWLIAGQPPRLGVYGLSGRRYVLQAASTVDGREGWSNVGTVVMASDYEEIAFEPPASGHRFYRLVERTGFDPGLQIERVGDRLRLRWSTGALEFAPAVTGPWQSVTGAAPPEHFIVPGQAMGFYRVRQ
jgi:hypothetical protein